MWFVLLGIALITVLAVGLYFRHRQQVVLRSFGVSPRARRVASLLTLWLLFGVPVLTFLIVLGSIALGSDSFTFVLPVAVEWVIVYPFWWAVLVVLQVVPFLLAIDLGARLATRRWDKTRVARAAAVASLLAFGVFAIYTPARIFFEAGDLNVRTYRVGPGGQAADRESEPLRIVFLADLQLDRNTDRARAQEVVEISNRANPDLVLVGGDWINTGPDFIDAAGDIAAGFSSRLGVASVVGDHEHFAYRDQKRSAREVTESLARANVPMHSDAVRWIDHRGKRIALVFLNYNYIQRAEPEVVERLLVEASPADYSILITHQLDTPLAKRIANRIDLALVAHTHGGQVNPFVGVAHLSIARAETPYISGRYELENTTIIVTSGIGFSIAPFRYAAPPSIEVIELSL